MDVSITSTTLSSLPHLMKPTTFQQHFTITSLLQEGYSCCQIQMMIASFGPTLRGFIGHHWWLLLACEWWHWTPTEWECGGGIIKGGYGDVDVTRCSTFIM
jgi:hypothetical protein